MHRFTEVRDEGVQAAARWRRSCMVAGVLVWLGTASVFAAEVDIPRGEQLVRDSKYAEAYDLLAPFADANKGNPQFDYLLGRAALGTNQAEKAKALFEQSLAARPGSIEAHLALGRAYYALRMYAEAKIEFETVLRFDNLPPDLLSQVQTSRRQRSSTRKVAV